VGATFRARAGRQTATALTAVGIFDGLSLEYGRKWRVGAFTGSQPDVRDFGLSGAVREHGLWLDWRETAEGSSRWRLTTGVVGSYTEGEINRENLVLQARYSGPRLFVSAIQDVDLNRGWKADAGESAVSVTSSFVTARYLVTERLSLDGGVDTRRSIRFYRDRETPETEFDDTYREGYWTGIVLRPSRSSRIGAQARRTTGGSSGDADTGTLTASNTWPSFRNLRIRLRSTGYRNETLSGWLHAVGVGLDVRNGIHADIGGGVRDESGLTRNAAADDIRWYSLDVDYRLTRAWFLLVSLERTLDADVSSDQVFLSGLYRF
ncbi:MAG: hypothetical protein HKN12_12030, partial [Gemmatimonadetes bacterium]|nr:hypothetical protein [Gemmatimonadota bacterium]